MTGRSSVPDWVHSRTVGRSRSLVSSSSSYRLSVARQIDVRLLNVERGSAAGQQRRLADTTAWQRTVDYTDTYRTVADQLRNVTTDSCDSQHTLHISTRFVNSTFIEIALLTVSIQIYALVFLLRQRQTNDNSFNT